jgi:DNA recombination protein RmuC
MGTTLKDLVEKSARLDEGLATSKEETEKLRSTADQLRQVLASPQQRGKWGERMVEDILNVMGLQEGINYQVQMTMGSGERPDYTFLLPKDKKVNLDVKFPIDQYERYLDAGSEAEADSAKKQFLSDVKNHVKEVSSRGYIDPESGTVDYVMVFIPNESIYGFIHQNDPQLLDFALENHIILCSPITLYAVLSLIHQAVRNFAMEERAGEIMRLLEQFNRQWGKYIEQMDKLGRSLDRAQQDFEALETTRSRQLEKPLSKILEIQEGRPEELAGGEDD